MTSSLLVTSLFAAPPAQAQDEDGPPNLVSNGDFSPPVADQWWGISDDDLQDGQLCITVPEHERFGNFVDLGLAEDETYLFGFTAHGDPGTGGLQAAVQSDGAAGPEIFDVQETFAVAGEPETFEWSFTASGDAQRVQFELSNADATSEVCLSQVYVTPITELLQNPTFDGLAPWWTTPNLTLEPGPDGGVCGTVPAGGEQWDVILGQGAVAIEEGATYTVTVTATAEPQAAARVLIPEPGVDWPPIYAADITLRPDGQSFTDTFEAELSADTEFQLQLGGNASEFDLCLHLASLTTGGEVEDFEHETGPRVRVNQVGYLPQGPKNATLVTDAEESLAWQLLDADGAEVATGATAPAGFDPSAGLDVHTIDFSEVKVSGTGFQLAADGEVSYPFDITETLYDDLRRDSLGIYYTQRSGIEITPIEADGELHKEDYVRPAGHVSEYGGADTNQGDLAVPCLPNEGAVDHQGSSQLGGYAHYGPDGWDCPQGYTLDVTGGWYDAGDHGKYVVNSGISVYQLLATYERTRHAGVVADGALGDSTLIIPERGNDVPDILDEVRWNLDWMLAMQVPDGTEMGIGGETIDAGGLAHHKLHDIAWTGMNMLPHEDPMPRYLHRPSTAATLNLAAAAAQGARLYDDYDPAYAEDLLAAARRAWDAAQAHPEIYAPNTNDLDPNPGGGPYDDSNLGDEFYWAAAQLYLTTGEEEFATAVLDSPYHVGGANEDIFDPAGFGWQWTAPAGRLDLATVPNNLPGRADVIDSVIEAADDYLATQAEQPFGQPYGVEFYDWGSAHQVINNAVAIATAYDLTGDPAYLDGGLEAIDYILGRNAINNSYVKGYGTHYSQNMHSRWYRSADRLPPFPDGKLAGGPNSGIQDPVAQANLQGCAPQACYIDDIGSWSTNETTINWNAALSWYASWAADMADGAPEWTPPTTTCQVSYTVHADWSGGFLTQVWVENLGPGSVDGWTLTWDFPGDQQVGHGWGAELRQSGSTVTATNPEWKPLLAAEGTAAGHTFGFVGDPAGASDHAPESVWLNGVRCALD
ncbi:glycoside hydrolase family 9 protein [Natronosporangium hydrolyticum]|uniref:Endoglucanase n=1 Tax=Natronosporangium hydrolyticum TaxID=2811111 RepID=A0A895YGJ5_9ACTN|nr:glycoside hydrolase family 9 protein [Natronosporangium hydrolyticum]QSB14629.1 glycoside hydrolase family 9 protein [Natronosporangium hydrolyticum]